METPQTIYYEDNVLSKLIINYSCFNKFKNFENYIPFSNFETLDLHSKIKESEDLIIFVFITTGYSFEYVKSKIPIGPVKFYFIIKDFEGTEEDLISFSPNYFCNWYLYWADVPRNISINSHDILESILNYYRKYPSPNERRIITYFNSKKHLEEYEFKRHIESNLDQILKIGRDITKEKNKEILRKISNSFSKEVFVNGLGYSTYYMVGHDDELAWTCFEKTNAHIVILMDIDLKNKNISYRVVDKSGDNLLCLEKEFLNLGKCFGRIGKIFLFKKDLDLKFLF